MNRYRALFRCRLCGETFSDTETGNREVALKAALFASMGRTSEPQAPALHEIHTCKNESIGIADFLGFKEEVDDA